MKQRVPSVGRIARNVLICNYPAFKVTIVHKSVESVKTSKYGNIWTATEPLAIGHFPDTRICPIMTVMALNS